jgi:deoxyribonuclease-1-like protein
MPSRTAAKEGAMKQLRTLLMLAVLAGGCWFVLQHVRLDEKGNLVLDWSSRAPAGTTPAGRPDDVLRIATFNIQVFGQSKLDKPHVMEILAQIARQFDIIAIQEVRSRQQDVLPRFVALINQGGYQYDYAIGPPLGRTVSTEQYAFVFDTTRVEIDRTAVYTVADPADRLHREPMVAAFRARGPPPEQAFTFTLVNIHTDPDEVPQELAALADAYLAVLHDGRGEDDIIVLGDFNAAPEQFGPLLRLPYLSWVVSDTPTNTARTKTYDNIVFHREATREFTGRGGVFDFREHFQLTREQALEISDHFPVWAEFSQYEGGRPGYVASRPTTAPASR